VERALAAGALEAVVAALRGCGVGEAATHGSMRLWALATLLQHTESTTRARALAAGALPALLALMRGNLAVAFDQRSGCNCLARLATMDDTQERSQMAAGDAADATALVLDAMAAHPADSALQRSACDALSRLYACTGRLRLQRRAALQSRPFALRCAPTRAKSQCSASAAARCTPSSGAT
jgi:hypothetical protein